MTFLAPLFLVGLLAVGVPVALHLMHRERPDAVRFPSLMFLKQIPHKSVRRRRLRDHLLLAARVLALVLLAAAFARPFVDRVPAAGSALLPARDLVVLIDRSYSMGHGDRFDRALDAARSQVDGLRREDRAAIAFFDERADVVTVQTGDRAVLRAALDTAQVGPRRTSYSAALRAAQALLDASERPQREVVLISDFQQGGWDGDESARLPEGMSLTTVPITDDAPANTMLAGVSIAREQFEGRERVRVTARIAHRGAAARSGTAALEVNGQAVQSVPFQVEAGGVSDVAFAPLTLPAGAARGTVRLDPDDLAADDTYHLVLSAARPLRVLLVEGPGSSAPSGLYLRRALAVGQDPAFAVSATGAIGAGDLADADVVLLNGARWPTGTAGERLDAFIAGGGGVLAVLGATGSLPGWVGQADAPVDRTRGGGGAIGWAEYTHPALELFRDPRNGDLGSARQYRYRALQPGDSTRVLARFDDGGAAILETRRGRGRVVVLTSTLDTYWSDLPLQPVFVPLLHRLTAYGADWRAERPAMTVGDALVVEDSMLTVVAPDGTPVQAGGGRGGAVLRLDQPGFYELREPAGSNVVRTIAANVDRAESDLTAMQPVALASAASARARDGAAMTDAAVLTLEERERRQALWWYVLAAAILLLAVETVLATRPSRALRSGGTP
ncbi:MAG TPA: VWA domain-containing protein [Longimicrobiales bacterium]|nr:VWA domain-containing protein [Longimicrobiales bacterium]